MLNMYVSLLCSLHLFLTILFFVKYHCAKEKKYTRTYYKHKKHPLCRAVNNVVVHIGIKHTSYIGLLPCWQQAANTADTVAHTPSGGAPPTPPRTAFWESQSYCWPGGKKMADVQPPPLRSLDDFLLGSARFAVPDVRDLDRWNNRIINNLLYYQSNYFLSAVLLLLLVG